MKQEIEMLNEVIEENNLETGGMTFEELQGNVGAQIVDAVKYIDDDVSPNRATATEYYRGEPFGNEEDGRSTVVDMTVRDTVGKIMPSLLRVFSGPKRSLSLLRRPPRIFPTPRKPLITLIIF